MFNLSTCLCLQSREQKEGEEWLLIVARLALINWSLQLEQCTLFCATNIRRIHTGPQLAYCTCLKPSSRQSFYFWFNRSRNSDMNVFRSWIGDITPVSVSFTDTSARNVNRAHLAWQKKKQLKKCSLLYLKNPKKKGHSKRAHLTYYGKMGTCNNHPGWDQATTDSKKTKVVASIPKELNFNPPSQYAI